MVPYHEPWIHNRRWSSMGIGSIIGRRSNQCVGLAMGMGPP